MIRLTDPEEHYICCSKAMKFALKVHKYQKRKYTGEPYFTHLAQVAGLASTVSSEEKYIATAWLHDCMEDCDVDFSTLNEMFGTEIATGVLLLSDLEAGNRELRKSLSCKRLGSAPAWVQDIKVCDLISNTSSIVLHDPKFAKTYMQEKRNLLHCLTKANTTLLDIAWGFVDKFDHTDV